MGEECYRGRQARADQGGVNCVEMLKGWRLRTGSISGLGSVAAGCGLDVSGF